MWTEPDLKRCSTTMSSKVDSTAQAWLRLAALGIAQSILRIRQSPCVRRAPKMPNQETICWRLIGAVSLGIRLVLLCFSSFLWCVSHRTVLAQRILRAPNSDVRVLKHPSLNMKRLRSLPHWYKRPTISTWWTRQANPAQNP